MIPSRLDPCVAEDNSSDNEEDFPVAPREKELEELMLEKADFLYVLSWMREPTTLYRPPQSPSSDKGAGRRECILYPQLSNLLNHCPSLTWWTTFCGDQW